MATPAAPIYGAGPDVIDENTIGTKIINGVHNMMLVICSVTEKAH